MTPDDMYAVDPECEALAEHFLADGRMLTLTVNENHYRLGVGVGPK